MPRASTAHNRMRMAECFIRSWNAACHKAWHAATWDCERRNALSRSSHRVFGWRRRELELDAVAALLLGAVHRLVGALDALDQVLAGQRLGHAEAARHLQAARPRMRGDRLPQPLGDAACLVRLGARTDQQ